MIVAGKSQACDGWCYLKIQCLLVLSGGRWGPKWKVELDTEEMAQPKWLKLIVKVLGMRVEPTTWEVLLEHSKLLGDLWDLFKGQLEELRGL